MEQVLYEVKKTIVGQDVLLERLLVALLARGHILVEGVPGLAKTQVDRFMMKVLVDYPSPTEEFVIVERAILPPPASQPVVDLGQLAELQAQVLRVYVDPALIEYSVALANATRRPDEIGLAKLTRYVTFGASPRASTNLALAARALAFIRGRA